jgi:hypothetical protein
MVQLSERAVESLEKKLNIKFNELMKLDDTAQTLLVEKRISKRLDFLGNQTLQNVSRGNPLLSLGRINTIEEINRRLDEIIS